ncbi:hypothetical protein WISP_55807 [Willisornis vidua]|uniref:Reverse transcriptase domain-containing protein n=1 Tax=Willisornis vidua TaxID=1566151 RepID=A0ABQ9DF02_9PASS|nr:hypothetical protein WISP_55807 [Willisornis vidua]
MENQKAFDTVHNSTLLDKLHKCGMSRFMICWAKNWLKARAQRVEVNGATSGASQGLVLGPVLFIIFITGLDAGVECTISMFVDDTKLGGAVHSLERQEALQSDLDGLEHWAMMDGMKFNKSKHWILQLGQSKVGHKYKLHPIPGYIQPSITSWSKKVIIPLYSTLVQPYLESCIELRTWLYRISYNWPWPINPACSDLSQSFPALQQINTLFQLGVVRKLTEGALDPLIQIIDEDI